MEKVFDLDQKFRDICSDYDPGIITDALDLSWASIVAWTDIELLEEAIEWSDNQKREWANIVHEQELIENGEMFYTEENQNIDEEQK